MKKFYKFNSSNNSIIQCPTNGYIDNKPISNLNAYFASNSLNEVKANELGYYELLLVDKSAIEYDPTEYELIFSYELEDREIQVEVPIDQPDNIISSEEEPSTELKTYIVKKIIQKYSLNKLSSNIEFNETQIDQEALLKQYEYAVQEHLNKVAMEKGYDNCYTCLSYLSSTNEKWYNESHIYNRWRDNVWTTCHKILNDFMAGEIEQPSIEDLISMLPLIDW